MAITKILNINEAYDRNPGAHLEHAITYIQNPDKTNEKVLVGSINCLPETAFSQMMDTKQMFGKTGKRQGYHIVISFPPGEATPEQAMEVTRQFAEEHLGENYEVVYAVHTDKEHCHGHIIWNSVSLTTGYKYDSPKGNWKRGLQPLTNRLCKKLGLSIMPAEYAKEPKNLSRKEWELEQKLREMILEDAVFCMRHAGSVEHFEFLMKRAGYEFKRDTYMSVKVPGRKWYHQLDKLDERFSEEKFKYYLDTGIGMPKFYAKNPYVLHRSGLSSYQKRFYGKIYRLRMVEQKRFTVGSAQFAKELQRFHQLQAEYLFLVDNNIKSIEELILYKVKNEMRRDDIHARQQELYRKNSVQKRACKTVEDIREYQIWHMDIQAELDELKQEKKQIKDNLRIVDGCLKEKLYTASFDITDMEEYVKTTVELPEYSYTKKEEPETQSEAIEVVEVPVLSVEETTVDKSASKVETTQGEKSAEKLTYEEYCLLSPEEKAETVGFVSMRSFETVKSIVEILFYDMEHNADVNEIMDEAKILYEGMEKHVIKLRVDEIIEGIEKIGFPYQCLTNKEKAELFRFQLDDNGYNLKLYSAVLKAAGVHYSMDESYEDYQKIYDKTVEMQTEKEVEVREDKRGMVR